MLQLYYLPGSPFARIARSLVLEMRLDCLQIEDQGYPPQQVAEINPAMQVPTLIDKERRLFGTRLIADYLFHLGTDLERSETPPLASAPLGGEDPWRDDQVLTALDALLSSLVTRSYLIWTKAAHQPGADIPLDMAARELKRSLSLLDWLEEEATAEGFLPGCLSLQDIWLIATLEWTEARIPIPWRARPCLEAIHARYYDRESLRATRPTPWQPDS